MNQGRTFAVRNLAEASLTVVPMPAVSAIATVAGVSVVLAITPVAPYGIAVTLLRISTAMGDEPAAPSAGPLKTFWDDPDTEEITVMGQDDDDDEPRESPTA